MEEQGLGSGRLPGASGAEARPGEGRRDFVHKIHVATREASESLSWLRLLAEAEIVPAAKLAALTQETDEIIAILVPIARSTSRPAEP